MQAATALCYKEGSYLPPTQQAMDMWLAFLAAACNSGASGGSDSDSLPNGWSVKPEAQASRDAALRQLLVSSAATFLYAHLLLCGDAAIFGAPALSSPCSPHFSPTALSPLTLAAVWS